MPVNCSDAVISKRHTARGLHRNIILNEQLQYICQFNHCLPSGAWSIATLEVVLTAKNGTQAYNS